MSSGSSSNPVNAVLGKAHDRGIHLTARPFILCFIAANFAFLTLAPGQVLRNFEFLLIISPIWLPIMLGYFSYHYWRIANRTEWLAKQEYILLELRVPRDVRKTPLAMETVLASLQISPGESTWWKTIVEGRTRPWWSFEIVSLGGRVHLYVWTREGFRRGLESYFYAQYPGIEIVEATDYSREVDPSHDPYDMWGCEFKFNREDPYPLKTYVDFMKPDSPMAKPEEQVDPLAQVIEYIGSLSPKEQFWIQILVRVSKDEKYAPFTIRDEAKKVLEELRKETVRKTSFVDASGVTRESESFPNPTRGIQNTMEAIERKISKPLFDVGIRSVYLAPKENYQGSSVAHLISMWRPFSSETLNKLGITRWFATLDDWPWEDRKGHLQAHMRHGLVDAYRRRSYFAEPYRFPWMVMNTEELATLFHIPSSGVTTPSLPRIQSSTAEAPSNLPT
ncbi:MAG: hypothetical protein AAB472_02095 [Patescibacteria group bacterium]